jgi:uncharacterized glyoxalase superfamily protein PhnB
MEVRMDDPFRRPALTSGVFYKEPWAALDWLEQPFGFERSMVITDKGREPRPLRNEVR